MRNPARLVTIKWIRGMYMVVVFDVRNTASESVWSNYKSFLKAEFNTINYLNLRMKLQNRMTDALDFKMLFDADWLEGSQVCYLIHKRWVELKCHKIPYCPLFLQPANIYLLLHSFIHFKQSNNLMCVFLQEEYHLPSLLFIFLVYKMRCPHYINFWGFLQYV